MGVLFGGFSVGSFRMEIASVFSSLMQMSSLVSDQLAASLISPLKHCLCLVALSQEVNISVVLRPIVQTFSVHFKTLLTCSW